MPVDVVKQRTMAQQNLSTFQILKEILRMEVYIYQNENSNKKFLNFLLGFEGSL